MQFPTTANGYFCWSSVSTGFGKVSSSISSVAISLATKAHTGISWCVEGIKNIFLKYIGPGLSFTASKGSIWFTALKGFVQTNPTASAIVLLILSLTAAGAYKLGSRNAQSIAS